MDAKTLMLEAVSEQTRRAYESDGAHFDQWRATHPTGSIADYLADCAKRGLKPSTIQRRLAGLNHRERTLGRPPVTPPDARLVLRGIARIGPLPQRKEPLFSSDLRAYFATLPDSVRNLRNKAILAVGLAGAFRRSEQAGIKVEDISDDPAGLRIAVFYGKRRADVLILFGRNPNTCPVMLLHRWLRVAGITSGPVFRQVHKYGKVLDGGIGGRMVTEIVKEAAAALGKDPALYSSQSFRRGFCTEATAAGASDLSIASHVRVGTLASLVNLTQADNAGRQAAERLGL